MRRASRLRAPIVALVTMTLAAFWLQLPVETIGSRFGELPNRLQENLPGLDLPPIS